MSRLLARHGVLQLTAFSGGPRGVCVQINDSEGLFVQLTRAEAALVLVELDRWLNGRPEVPVDTEGPPPEGPIELLRDLASDGIRFDLTPTAPLTDAAAAHRFYQWYLSQIDERIRARAAGALRRGSR